MDTKVILYGASTLASTEKSKNTCSAIVARKIHTPIFPQRYRLIQTGSLPDMLSFCLHIAVKQLKMN